ncbi:MAG: polysaccharide deacetylase family protein [Cyanobacteria bacterium J06626_6]
MPSVCSDSPSALLPLKTVPAPKLKLKVKQMVSQALYSLSYRSGLSSLYARIRTRVKRDSVATILMYHSVPEPREIPWMDPGNCLPAERFEQHMRFLAKHRHVISLDQLVQALEKGEPIRRGTVAITLDDGYLNNLTVAAPILAKYGLPATLYLATASIDAGENQWIDTLYSAFRARSRHVLSLSHLNLSHLTLDHPNLSDGSLSDGSLSDWKLADWKLADWKLDSETACQVAYRAIARHLIVCTPLQRDQILQAVDQQLRPTVYPPRMTLTWDDVRELRQRYPMIDLGVHTASHIDLQTHWQDTEHELQLSINRLLTETGDRPQHLAFPYNRYCVESQTQAAAYLRSAVATSEADPVVRAHTDRYALPRLEAPESMLLLKAWTNGGFPDVPQRLFGRALTQSF